MEVMGLGVTTNHHLREICFETISHLLRNQTQKGNYWYNTSLNIDYKFHCHVSGSNFDRLYFTTALQRRQSRYNAQSWLVFKILTLKRIHSIKFTRASTIGENVITICWADRCLKIHSVKWIHYIPFCPHLLCILCIYLSIYHRFPNKIMWTGIFFFS